MVEFEHVSINWVLKEDFVTKFAEDFFSVEISNLQKHFILVITGLSR